MALIEHFIEIKYRLKIDSDTGEIISSEIVDKSDIKESKKKVRAPKVDDSVEPKLILEESKYRLTSSATTLMGVVPDDKIDIKYDIIKGVTIPVIGNCEAFDSNGGNKLTKSLTVAFRGNKNTELAKFGNEFVIKPHPSKDGLFILDSGKIQEEIKGDDNVNIEAEDEIQLDLNLNEIGGIEDNDITEIDSSFFQL